MDDIRGATPHFDHVAAEVSKGTASVALETGGPVAFGVLTTDTIEQAVERIDHRASVELVQGQNILSANGKLDWSERFSEYIVKGQGGFSEETDGEKQESGQCASVSLEVARR